MEMFPERLLPLVIVDSVAGTFLQEKHLQTSYQDFFHAVIMALARIGRTGKMLIQTPVMPLKFPTVGIQYALTAFG
jgi:hypothetical protein